jgi:hypothetical protein
MFSNGILNDLKIDDKNSEFIFQTNELKSNRYLQIFLILFFENVINLS